MSAKLRKAPILGVLLGLIAACAGSPTRPSGSDPAGDPPSAATSTGSGPAADPGRAPALGRLGSLSPATSGGSTGTTTPTTPPAAPSRSSPPGWRLIFHEDFGTNVSPGGFLSTYRDFGAYPWGWLDTSKRGHYDPSVLSVSAGIMTMHLYTSADGIHHVAALYPRLPGGWNQLYGRYSVRFRADPVAGYKAAWLLWPQSEVWSDGEIDFPEGDLTGKISVFLHHVGAPADQDYFGTGAGFVDWHIATIEWSPNKVVFAFDGRVIGTSTRHVPATPMHYVLQTETALGSEPVPSTAAGNVQVDWVSVWGYAPTR
jgi:hypothetical protein